MNLSNLSSTQILQKIILEIKLKNIPLFIYLFPKCCNSDYDIIYETITKHGQEKSIEFLDLFFNTSISNYGKEFIKFSEKHEKIGLKNAVNFNNDELVKYFLNRDIIGYSLYDLIYYANNLKMVKVLLESNRYTISKNVIERCIELEKDNNIIQYLIDNYSDDYITLLNILICTMKFCTNKNKENIQYILNKIDKIKNPTTINLKKNEKIILLAIKWDIFNVFNFFIEPFVDIKNIQYLITIACKKQRVEFLKILLEKQKINNIVLFNNLYDNCTNNCIKELLHKEINRIYIDLLTKTSLNINIIKIIINYII